MKKSKLNLFIGLLFLVLLIIGAFLLLPSLNKGFYPREYEEYVEKYSAEYNVPEPLIYAVIQNESGFDPNAESSVGAKGLMQLMPETFDWVSGRLGEKEKSITDPETNIKYGTYYLSWLYANFEDWETAIAAYNAGHGRVGAWLEDSRYSSDGMTLDNIPLDETSNYVNNVVASRRRYEEIYYNGD